MVASVSYDSPFISNRGRAPSFCCLSDCLFWAGEHVPSCHLLLFWRKSLEMPLFRDQLRGNRIHRILKSCTGCYASQRGYQLTPGSIFDLSLRAKSSPILLNFTNPLVMYIFKHEGASRAKVSTRVSRATKIVRNCAEYHICARKINYIFSKYLCIRQANKERGTPPTRMPCIADGLSISPPTNFVTGQGILHR